MKPMKNRLSSAGLLAAALCTFGGCGDDPAQPPAQPPEQPSDPPSRTFLPLDSDVVFQVYEAYGTPDDQYPNLNAVSEPRVAIRVRTEREYTCSNYDIEYKKAISKSRVVLQLTGVSLGPGCATSIGPAKTAFFADLETGTYELVVLHDVRTAEFLVSVSDESFSVSPSEDAFARTEHSLYWRYPPKSFVYLCGTTNITRSMCSDFIEGLSRLVPIEEFSFPQTGHAPWPGSADGYQYAAPVRYFRYSDEADFQRAGATLEAYARDVIGSQQGIGISIRSWRNERFLSWLYRDP